MADVLVVEDEIEIRELMSLLLLRQGHTVKQCASVPEAMDCLKKSQFDLIVLDWMLPQVNGIEMLKSMPQSDGRPPVLMVTAKAEPQDIVTGLEAGADDYVAKPFEPSVFNARVTALLRRSGQLKDKKANQETLQFGSMVIDLKAYEVRIQGQVVHMTPSEFKIIAYMGQNAGRVMTRDHLISIVQGDGISVTGRTIDTHVFGMRKKLGECADFIETIRGVGYRMKSEI